MATFAPQDASVRTITRPSWLVPPVTTTVFLDRSIFILVSSEIGTWNLESHTACLVSAVHPQGDSVDVLCFGRGQEHHGIPDVFRRADAANGNPCFDHFCRARLQPVILRHGRQD